MFVRSNQLQTLAGAGENTFLQRLTAHQAQSFPQLASATSLNVVQTAASAAVAQFHGFSAQQEMAVCSDCVLPFTAGVANPGAVQEGANKPLQTLVSDTQSVLGRLNIPASWSPSTPEDFSALKQHCAALAATTGSSPLNIDRSGPVVPYTEHSPVKPADLVAAAKTALPVASSQPTAVTQQQLTEAVAAAGESFPKSAPQALVHSCKPLADLEFRRVYWDGTPMPKIPYTVTLADGSKRSGTTDSNGLGSHTGVTPGAATVVYGPDTNPAKSSISHEFDDDFAKILRYRSEIGGF